LSSQKEKLFGSVETAKMIGIEVHRLYGWERHGVVKPVLKYFCTRRFRRFSEEDVRRGRFVKRMVDEEGYTLITAVRKLEK